MISQAILEVHKPNEAWLHHPSRIHGTGHLTRVFILQELLCEQMVKLGVKVDRDAPR